MQAPWPLVSSLLAPCLLSFPNSLGRGGREWVICLKETQPCTCKFSELCPGEPGRQIQTGRRSTPTPSVCDQPKQTEEPHVCREMPWEKGRSVYASPGAPSDLCPIPQRPPPALPKVAEADGNRAQPYFWLLP